MSPSPSSISFAAFVLALAALPQDAVAFPTSRIPTRPVSPANNVACRYGLDRCAVRPGRRRPAPLYAVDMPPMRPMEDEKEKRSRRSDDGSSGSEETGEWKRVVGGFVPNFLKRGGDASTTTNAPYPAVETVDTLEDYKRAVVDVDDALVVVRFFAPWCKSCKAAHPLFKKMVSDHAASAVKFVEVPLTRETAYIHEGLGVPSVPFGHIYHPEAGLVEERKINKRVFKEFREALDSYVVGSCDLPPDEDGEDEDDDEIGFQ